MISRTNFQVARGHLTSRVKQVLVATLSVTFGISMYIFMNGFMTGVNDIQAELAFSTLAHIRIYNDLPEDRSNLLENVHNKDRLVNVRHPKVIQYTEGIINADKIINTVSQIPEVDEITAQVNMNVFYRNGATKVNGLLAGVYASQEHKLFGTADAMLKGEWLSLDKRSDGIIMGVGLAKKLGLGLHDNVGISTVDGVTRNFKIIGLIQTSLANIDNGKAFIQISSARQLLSKNFSYVGSTILK